MSTLRVSILGAGNAGLTAAYHLSQQGTIAVCLYGAPGFDEQLDAIAEAGGIRARAEKEGAPLLLAGLARPHTLTRSLAEAAAFADVLILPVPSFAQEALFFRVAASSTRWPVDLSDARQLRVASVTPLATAKRLWASGTDFCRLHLHSVGYPHCRPCRAGHLWYQAGTTSSSIAG